jgi:hypothetical protein
MNFSLPVGTFLIVFLIRGGFMQGTRLERKAVCLPDKFYTLQLTINIKFLKEDYYV